MMQNHVTVNSLKELEIYKNVYWYQTLQYLVIYDVIITLLLMLI